MIGLRSSIRQLLFGKSLGPLSLLPGCEDLPTVPYVRATDPTRKFPRTQLSNFGIDNHTVVE